MGAKRGRNGRRKEGSMILPSPTANHHSDSPSVLKSTRDEKPLRYTLQIQSFSLLKSTLARFQRQRYETQTFHAGRYKWKLALYPNGNEKRNGSGHISLYLVMAGNDILSTVSGVNVVFTLLVYDKLRDKYLTVQGKGWVVGGEENSSGISNIVMSLSDLKNPTKGFISNDTLIVEVKMNAISTLKKLS